MKKPAFPCLGFMIMALLSSCASPSSPSSPSSSSSTDQTTPATHSITFQSSGGTGWMSDQTMAAGSSAPLTANAYTLFGNLFLGWASSPTGSVEYHDGQTFTMGKNNVVLYAVWQPVSPITITFWLTSFYSLGFSPSTFIISPNTTLTISPQLNVTGTNWKWYVNGIRDMSQTTSTFSYTPTSAGTDVISVTVIYNNVGYSGTLTGTVVQ